MTETAAAEFIATTLLTIVTTYEYHSLDALLSDNHGATAREVVEDTARNLRIKVDDELYAAGVAEARELVS